MWKPRRRYTNKELISPWMTRARRVWDSYQFCHRIPSLPIRWYQLHHLCMPARVNRGLDGSTGKGRAGQVWKRGRDRFPEMEMNFGSNFAAVKMSRRENWKFTPFSAGMNQMMWLSNDRGPFHNYQNRNRKWGEGKNDLSEMMLRDF